MKAAVSIFVFLIAAGMAIVFILSVKESEKITKTQPILICGYTFLEEHLTEAQKQGEALFKIKCAACHKLDAQSTGPPLRSVKARYEEEKEISIDSFLSVRRASFTEIFNSKERKCLIPPEITNADIQNILQYTQ
ncbi:cbb3-type cytochrome c oxidase subunit III [Kordia periserrulae]|uniref:Cbb3-type cytochrome c oxidase subunit III n=1 Tax=Kordia periserrulae TaxID=701523 RepID=A0A2T6C799_9FLAO|nr:cytochrome c [Kordia periserrulae]PTX64199.1 cbb3-type cytochrome c oxidase subunit III [Kordia periserrulae]